MTLQELEDFIQSEPTRWTTGHYPIVYGIARALGRTIGMVTALEIGVGSGAMTVSILGGLVAGGAQARLYSVDEYASGIEELDTTRARLDRYGLLPFWTFFRADSHKWTPPEVRFDLAVIDGDHTREGMRQDFELCAGHLASHGLILMHDTEVHQGREFIKSVDPAQWQNVTLPFYNGLSILRRAADPSFGYRQIEAW